MMRSEPFWCLRMGLPAALILAGPAAMGQGSASLTLHIALNEPDAGGVLRVALCPDKASYDEEKGCTVLTLEAADPLVMHTVPDLQPGSWAVKVFHDIDRDGALKTSWIGWPQEPFGFSNDAPVNIGPPSFKLAMITLNEGTNTTRIRLR